MNANLPADPFELVASIKHAYDEKWRISDDLIEALPPLLWKLQPRAILEFGPGLSSFIYLHYILMTNGRYAAVDDLNPFALEHKERLRSFDLLPGWTHITEFAHDGWYQPSKYVLGLGPFDLISIDGPGDDAARICPRAMRTYADVSTYNKTTWVIDDTSREHSAALVAHIARVAFLDEPHVVIIKDRNWPRLSTIITPKVK